MKKSKPLRFHIFMPMAVVFTLLWALTAALFHNRSWEALESQVGDDRIRLSYEVMEQWSYYRHNREKGLGDEAMDILTYNISGRGLWAPGLEGVALAGVRDEEGRVMVGQIAMGYGHEAGVDQGQRWTLYFDDMLSDEDQIALALWLNDHAQRGGQYALYPPESAEMGDGTIARVTGARRTGFGIDVEKIELLHPDGSHEVMMDTQTGAAQQISMEFRYLKVHSLLQSGRSSEQEREEMAARTLRHYHQAKEQLPYKTGGQTNNGYRRFDLADDKAQAGYYVTSSADTESYAWEQDRPFLIYSLLLTLGAALILSVNLSHKVNEPVEQLCTQVKEGICREGPIRELNLLARAFNAQQKKMEDQLKRERDFTRAAAHELKTPLAVLRAHAEALQEDIVPDKRGEYLDIMIEETDQMTGLVNRLLELSRLEAGSTVPCGMVELSALVGEVFAPLSLSFERRGMRLRLDAAEVWMEGDREQLREAVENLALNALHYGRDGGSILVELRQEKEWIRLCVQNEADPIPQGDLEHLFEPFYRVDKARSRAEGGSGLGLAIVRAAVQAHGGSCKIENLTGAVQVTVELPVQQPVLPGN